jgi:Ca2+-binding RTX toxin-like protein
MPTLRAAALGAVLVPLLLAAPAQAGTVTGGLGLVYTAADGEANALTISRSGDDIVFTETGGVPIAESAATCEATAPNVVRCTAVPAPAGIDVGLGDGDDRLVLGAVGGAVRAYADGGAGADRLDAAAATGYVELLGGADGDRLFAGTGESDLTGGPGADTLTGGPDGALTAYLMGTGGDGADLVLGGAGFDVAGYAQRTAPLTLSANGAADDGEAGEGDNLAPAVERLEGGAGADRLIASAVVDAELSGGPGLDELTGGPRDDLLAGGDGDDALAGGAGDDLAAPSDAIAAPGEGGAGPGENEGSEVDAGADTFSGGDGFDTLSYATRVAPVTATLDGQADDGEASERDNAGPDVESVTGGRGADTLTGSARAERLTGGPGNDTIDPGSGVDEVRAGEGDDTVRAQDGSSEWISCGAGTDALTGDHDDVPVSCETATLAPAPASRDTRKPRVRMDSLPARPRYRHVRRGLRPRLTTNEPTSYVVELLGAATSAHISAARPFNLVLARRTIPRTSQPRRITLRPKRALLGPRRKLRVRIRVTATDAAGNVRVVRKTLKARR